MGEWISRGFPVLKIEIVANIVVKYFVCCHNQNMEDVASFDLGELLQNPMIEMDFLDNEDSMLLNSLEEFEAEQKQLQNQNTRFVNMDEDNLKKFEDSNQSKSTKNNTKWALKIVQGTIMSLFFSLNCFIAPATSPSPPPGTQGSKKLGSQALSIFKLQLF